MSLRRSLLFFTLLITGYCLIFWGQWATVYRDDALAWTAANLGRPGLRMLNIVLEGMPPGAFLAVCSMLLGAGLVTAAIHFASAPVELELATSASGDNRFASVDVRRHAWVAVLLAAVTFILCRLETPNNIAVVTWVGSLVSGFYASVSIDRRRGTSPRRPFDSNREVVVVSLLTLLCVVVVAHDLMGWRWSGTPDESNFFGVAKAMADGTAQRFLLSERGVFEVHPTLSSVFQTAFIVVLRAPGFAWRFSSVAAFAMSLPALYWLTSRLWNARVATIATALFATTPVAVGFAHLGYNNTQLYPVVLGGLALLAWAQRDDSVTIFYLAGCLAGLAFYSYYPARLTLALALWLGVCLGAFARARGGRWRAAVLLFAFALAIVPVAAHPLETLGRMFQFTVFTEGGQEKASDLASAWHLLTATNFVNLANQVLLSLVYSVYFVGPHHFQWPPVVDPISGPLVLVGLGLCVAGLRRRNALFIAVAYVVSAALIGGTSHYFRPPLTRLLFLSPFAAVLAAVALDRFAVALSRATRLPRLGSGVVVTLTIAAVIWGIGWMQYNVRYRYHGYGDGTTSELIRLAVEQPEDMKLVYIQRIDTGMWSVEDIMDEYGLKERLEFHRGLENAARQTLAKIEPPFMVVLGLGSDADRLEAEGILAPRFPQKQWQSSDANEVWNLRYFIVGR